MPHDSPNSSLRELLPTLTRIFSAAAADVAAMPDGESRAGSWRELATLLVAMPEEFRQGAYRDHPELEMAQPFPDTRLIAAEQALVAQLSEHELELVDRALVASSAATWRKMRRVIGGAMVALGDQFVPLPLGLYVRRISALVEREELLAQGELDFAALCDVRLPESGRDAR